MCLFPFSAHFTVGQTALHVVASNNNVEMAEVSSNNNTLIPTAAVYDVGLHVFLFFRIFALLFIS